MGEKTVSDLSYLREMAMGDEEIVIQTVETYLKNTPQNLEDLNHYYADQLWEEVARAAHKVKPNLKYMGMDRAYELILEIEKQVKIQPGSKALETKIQELGLLCEQAHQELSIKVERWYS